MGKDDTDAVYNLKVLSPNEGRRTTRQDSPYLAFYPHPSCAQVSVDLSNQCPTNLPWLLVIGVKHCSADDVRSSSTSR